MATALQDKIDKRANIWEQMKAINDRNVAGEATGEDLEAYARAEKEYDELDAMITAAENHARRELLNSGAADKLRDQPAAEDDRDEQAYAKAFEMFVKNGLTDMEPEARAALRGRSVNFNAKEIRNAGATSPGSAGGYLIPTGFREVIIEKMKAFGNVEGVATVIETETGNPLPWATNDDTGNVGALLAENTAATEQDFVFGTAQLGAYKYTTKLVRESIEFLQDVNWTNIEQFLGRKLAERLARIHNQHFTTGTGVGQPQGIVTGAVDGVTAASTTAVTADELIDLQHSVDVAYRNERSKFMLSDTALKGLRKLKYTGSGEYIFQPGIAAGVPSLLAGAGYVINNDMAVPATGVRSILFGDFEAGYVVRHVKGLELLRLAERYAEFGQVGFIGFDRVDGLVQDNSAYKALKQA